VPNHLCIRNHDIGNHCREPFRKTIVSARDVAPLFSETLDAVHIQRKRCSCETRDEAEHSIGGVTHQNAFESLRYGVQDRQKRVSYGIEMLCSDRRKNGELYTFIGLLWISNVVGPAVYRHVMTARSETRRKFLGESFEPAVVCRNATGPDDGQFHGFAIIDYAFSPCRISSGSAETIFPRHCPFSSAWSRWNLPASIKI